MDFDPTKPCRTRNGGPARIVCTDRKQSGYPILACIGRFDETIVSYTAEGTCGLYQSSSGEHENMKGVFDLVNIPEKHKGWINITPTDLGEQPAGMIYLRHGNLWPTKEEAVRNRGNGPNLACLEIEFEEGEGL